LSKNTESRRRASSLKPGFLASWMLTLLSAKVHYSARCRFSCLNTSSKRSLDVSVPYPLPQAIFSPCQANISGCVPQLESVNSNYRPADRFVAGFFFDDVGSSSRVFSFQLFRELSLQRLLRDHMVWKERAKRMISSSFCHLWSTIRSSRSSARRTTSIPESKTINQCSVFRQVIR